MITLITLGVGIPSRITLITLIALIALIILTFSLSKDFFDIVTVDHRGLKHLGAAEHLPSVEREREKEREIYQGY